MIDHSLVPPSRRISMKFSSSNVGLSRDSLKLLVVLLKLSQIPCALSNIKKNLQRKQRLETSFEMDKVQGVLTVAKLEHTDDSLSFQVQFERPKHTLCQAIFELIHF